MAFQQTWSNCPWIYPFPWLFRRLDAATKLRWQIKVLRKPRSTLGDENRSTYSPISGLQSVTWYSTQPFFIACFSWMMNQIFTSKKCWKSPFPSIKIIWLCRVPGTWLSDSKRKVFPVEKMVASCIYIYICFFLLVFSQVFLLGVAFFWGRDGRFHEELDSFVIRMFQTVIRTRSVLYFLYGILDKAPNISLPVARWDILSPSKRAND